MVQQDDSNEEYELVQRPRGSSSSSRGPREENSESQSASLQPGSPATPVMEIANRTIEEDDLSAEQLELDRRTVRKFDIILLPFLALIFLFNSLDRANIGNAETANFTSDVGLEKRDLNTAVALFFLFFVALQPAGAALGRKVGMSLWVPTTMSIWGACTTLHIWIGARWQLYTLRIVIGILEAGFYPVTVSYLSLFYTRYEFGRRLALFYGQYAIAGALGGVLSYFIFSRFDRESDTGGGKRDGPGEWHSWQVLFLLEGVSTMIVALIGFFWLPRNAGSAWFLTAEEKAWAEERIRRDRTINEYHASPKSVTAAVDDDDDLEPTTDSSEAHHLLSSSRYSTASSSQQFTDSRGLTAHDITSALLTPKIYHILVCNVLSSIPVTAFAVFLPLVLKPLMASSALANLLTAPPYICGAIVLYAFTSWSDRHRERLKPILISLAIILAGLLAVVMMPSTKGWAVPRYFALCVLLSGTFVASPVTVAWISGNTPAPGKRALLLGINGWGNLAGLFSALIFAPRFGPSYHTSFWIATVCVGIAALGYFLFRVALMRENAARRRMLEGWDADEVRREEVDGKGPYQGEFRTAVLRAVVPFVTRAGFVKTGRWLDEVLDEGREGDERITFMYGL